MWLSTQRGAPNAIDGRMEKENHPLFWQFNVTIRLPTKRIKTNGFLAPKALDQAQCNKRCVQCNISGNFS
jgi:hypothetical protein